MLLKIVIIMAAAYFNLPFSIHLTKRYPVDSRFKVATLDDLNYLGTAFAGLGPIWVDSEEWYYYFTDETTWKRWPTGSGTGGGAGEEYLFKQLHIDYKGQESISIDNSYNSDFIMIENLIFKKGIEYTETMNGFQKYINWNNKNGILEEDDKVILVYKEI